MNTPGQLTRPARLPLNDAVDQAFEGRSVQRRERLAGFG